jgi:hypothetical protein
LLLPRPGTKVPEKSADPAVLGGFAALFCHFRALFGRFVYLFRPKSALQRRQADMFESKQRRFVIKQACLASNQRCSEALLTCESTTQRSTDLLSRDKTTNHVVVGPKQRCLAI